MFVANFHSKYRVAVQKAIDTLDLNQHLYISDTAYDDFGSDLFTHNSLHMRNKIDLDQFKKSVDEICNKMILVDHEYYN